MVVEAFAGGVDSARDISVTFQPMHLAVSVRGDRCSSAFDTCVDPAVSGNYNISKELPCLPTACTSLRESHRQVMTPAPLPRSIISGPLCEPIHPDECSWQFDGTGKDRRVVLTLTKARASISPWQSLIK